MSHNCKGKSPLSPFSKIQVQCFPDNFGSCFSHKFLHIAGIQTPMHMQPQAQKSWYRIAQLRRQSSQRTQAGMWQLLKVALTWLYMESTNMGEFPEKWISAYLLHALLIHGFYFFTQNLWRVLWWLVGWFCCFRPKSTAMVIASATDTKAMGRQLF